MVSVSRLRGSAPILSAILLVVALVCGFSISTSVYVDQQGTEGLRAELATRSGAELALRASLDLADDAAQQDAEVRAAIANTFASTGVSFDTLRTLEAGAIFSLAERSAPVSALTMPDLDSLATFDSGADATTASEVAIQTDAAALLDLRVGDEVEINEIPFTVSGTWRPIDPLDPRWYGDEAVANGGTDRLGPFVLTEDAWPRLELAPTAVWTIVPVSTDQFTATNSSSVSAAWATIKPGWRGEVSGFDSIEVQRRLARTLDEFDRRIEGLRAIEPVAAVLVAGSALVVLSQLVQLLVATRERETLLFWARGRSIIAIAVRSALEVAGTVLLGAIVGASAVVIGLVVVSDVGPLQLFRPSAFVGPAVVVIGAIVLAAVTSFRSAVSVTQSTKGGRGDSRARRVAIPGVVILVAAAAALAVWQLQLYGSPLTPDAEGASSIDPIVVVAPTAALVAVVLAALAAFPGVVALYSRRTRNSGAGAHLTARTLARQTSRVAAPLVIVALAVGTITMGASFSATWAQLFTQTAALHAGADVRISSPLAPFSAQQLDAVAATEHITAVAPLSMQALSVGAVTGTVVAATPDALKQLATDAGGVFSPDDAADAITVDNPGPQIPEGTTNLTLRVEALDFDEPPALSGWIADSVGSVREVQFDDPTAQDGGILAYTAALEAPTTRLSSLLSLDVSFASQLSDETRPSFRLQSLDAEVGGEVEKLELDQFWVLDTLSDILVPPRVNAEGDGFELDDALPSIRMTATFDGTERDSVRPGVVVTERLARFLDLQVGDIIAFSLREVIGDVNTEVKQIVPAIPAADTDLALLMDLSVINHFHQRVSREPAESTDIWVTTTDQTGVRDNVRAVIPANAQVELSDDPIGRQVLSAAPVALWAAAVCCLLFALVAVGSASSSRLRWGRRDIASLRAIGMDAREQSAAVVRELIVVLAVALGAGVLAGVIVSVLTVPQLARAAVGGGYLAPSLSVDGLGLGLVAVLAVGIAVILLDVGRRVRSLASRLLPDEAHE